MAGDVLVRKVVVWHGRPGMVRPGKSGVGPDRQVWGGWYRRVLVRQGVVWQAGSGDGGLGRASQGLAGGAWCVSVRIGKARRGQAGMDRSVLDR
jgi:hypothetical protein